MREIDVRQIFMRCMVGGLVILGTGSGSSKAMAMQPDRADVEAEVQILTRGPVHEAFAETILFDPEPDVVVTRAVPDSIEELPPDQRPEGDNVTWIPGYWAWDDDRNDFLWVSGVWRALPPGRQWMSGYWGRSSRGSQWTSGYWADAELTEIEYLPEPPDSVEAGPNIQAPSADYIWIPGCWVWHHGGYAWRPGYWERAESDWNWVPDHYVSAPRGYVFVDGYWDYSVSRRGVLFAPVYFDPLVSTRAGFRYSPATVIDLGVFNDHLFLRSRSRHYYFGDYYAADYRDAGFYSRFSFQSSGRGYDPIYAHQRWQHRENHDWERHVEVDFQYRRDHEDARPPRTLTLQIALGANAVKSRERGLVVATSLDRLTKSQDGPVRFQRVEPEERREIVQRKQAVQSFREERQKREVKVVDSSDDEPAKEFAPTRVRISKSPIAARRASEFAKDRAPPKVQKAPAPDLKVKPNPRKNDGKRPVLKAEPKDRGGRP